MVAHRGKTVRHDAEANTLNTSSGYAERLNQNHVLTEKRLPRIFDPGMATFLTPLPQPYRLGCDSDDDTQLLSIKNISFTWFI